MKKRTKIHNYSIIILISPCFFVCAAIVKLFIVGTFDVVDGINLQDFAAERQTARVTLTAKRGTIYDRNGEILAQDVNSYTVIAYLDSSRTENPEYPRHVVDVNKTAKALSKIINMSEKTLINLMSQDGLYQVELGPGGRGITELVKDEIEALDLPGIDFIETTKRYYPYGNFLSYTLGYAKTDDEGKIYGEFGLEYYYNKELSGEDGYKEYQKDLYGYQIVGKEAYVKESKDGSDLHLTIDVNIQMFLEKIVKNLEKIGQDWTIFTVADAHTGEILGTASSPNFDPNIIDIKDYHDPLISYAYEPGSIMKTYTWLASIENGQYKGSSKFKSGSMSIGSSKVNDWWPSGWGNMTYDDGYIISSNVAATKLAQKLGRSKLKDFYFKLGFGEPTNVYGKKSDITSEFYGNLNFKYDIELATASFGQGVMTTPIQHIQALTAITNDGTLLKPYIVKEISNSDGTKQEFGRTEIRRVASSDSIKQIKKLMYDYVNGDSPFVEYSNSKFYLKGYEICGKTGTAEYASSSGGYSEGYYDYIRSFAGFFPYEDPEVIILVSVKDLNYKKGTELSSAVKQAVKDISTYLNINGTSKTVKDRTLKVESYINKEYETVSEYLTKKNMNVIKIGNGSIIINQYPEKGTTINKGNKVFLLTNDTNYTMPNMVGWSRSEVLSYTNLIGLTPEFSGVGHVKTQNIKQGTKLDKLSELKFVLENKYQENNTTNDKKT